MACLELERSPDFEKGCQTRDTLSLSKPVKPRDKIRILDQRMSFLYLPSGGKCGLESLEVRT